MRGPNNRRLVPAPPAVRSALERALQRVDPRPPGAPEAILLVRRLRLPPPNGSLAWDRTLRARLDACARAAARPARGAVPADAPAVVFAGPAELLACLADDLARGAASACWWWDAYLRGRPAASLHLPAVLGADLRVLPAAFALLAASRRAATVLATIPAPAARDLALAVARAYGAGDLDLPLADAGGPAGEDAATTHAGGRRLPAAAAPSQSLAAAAAPRPMVHPAPPPRPAPWTALVPWDTVQLPREHALLLGVALALHYQPTAVRVPAFQHALAAWWVAADPAVARQDSQQRRPPSVAETPLPPTTQPAGGDVPALSWPAMPSRVRRPTAGIARPITRRGGAPTLRGPAHRSAAPELAGGTAPAEPSTPANAGAARLDPRAVDPPRMPGTHPDATPERGSAEPAVIADTPPVEKEAIGLLDASLPALEDGVTTGLGGVLFLVNLIIHLGLPECFPLRWGLASGAGPWALLELLGRALLDDPARWAGDPIWAVLARLDGRQPGSPGVPRALPARARRAAPQPCYRIPARWLRGLPRDAGEHIGWSRVRGRLRLWSSRGFLLYEGAAPRPGARGAHAVLNRLGLAGQPLRRMDAADVPVARPADPVLAAVPPWLRHWLAAVLPYARLRLALALALDPARPAIEAELLVRRGRLFASATHVDLVMGMDAVSLPVRLAGLDRDPGWIADFGRVISFHFVDDG